MESFGEIFDLVKQQCQSTMPSMPYVIWIKDIECVDLNSDEAMLMVTTDLRKNIVETRYLDVLQNAFAEVMGFPIKVKIVSEEERQSDKPKPEEPQELKIEEIAPMPGSEPPAAAAAAESSLKPDSSLWEVPPILRSKAD